VPSLCAHSYYNKTMVFCLCLKLDWVDDMVSKLSDLLSYCLNYSVFVLKCNTLAIFLGTQMKHVAILTSFEHCWLIRIGYFNSDVDVETFNFVETPNQKSTWFQHVNLNQKGSCFYNMTCISRRQIGLEVKQHYLD
jgi:hypothetical protein